MKMADTREEGLLKDAVAVSERANELHQAAMVSGGRRSVEELSLRHRASALDSVLRRLSSSAKSARASLDPKISGEIDEQLNKARCLISDGDVSSFLPSRAHGRFLKMFLGPIDVRATRKEEKLKIKEEYNRYRDRTAFLFLLFPSTLLVLRSRIWSGCFPALPVQFYQAWLLVLYTNLALRENILRVNGSDIRPWWIYHHYCAMLMAVVSLTWEIKGQGEADCANKQVFRFPVLFFLIILAWANQKGVELFLAWAIMQGVATLLQNRYQRQRLYTRIALGKAKRMDVVWGETAGVEGQLWPFYPILFILQGFEAYIGILLLKTAFFGFIPQWQVVVCGVLLVVMAIGNFLNTVETLISKFKIKAQVKKIRSQK